MLVRHTYVRSTLGVILGLSSGSLGAGLFFHGAFLARSTFFFFHKCMRTSNVLPPQRLPAKWRFEVDWVQPL